MRTTRGLVARVAVVGALALAGIGAAGDAANVDSPAQSGGGSMKRETATFAAGCFWGVEAAFRQVQGVTDTMVGYTGGQTQHPTYEDVCAHTTGHAEAVQVEYDPAQVSYDDLLQVFFSLHDPTTPNRQGPDVGSNYRSALFYHTPEQRAAAEASMATLEREHRFKHRPIVTELVPSAEFWRAEEYHQRYAEKHGGVQCHLPLGIKTKKP